MNKMDAIIDDSLAAAVDKLDGAKCYECGGVFLCEAELEAHDCEKYDPTCEAEYQLNEVLKENARGNR